MRYITVSPNELQALVVFPVLCIGSPTFDFHVKQLIFRLFLHQRLFLIYAPCTAVFRVQGAFSCFFPAPKISRNPLAATPENLIRGIRARFLSRDMGEKSCFVNDPALWFLLICIPFGERKASVFLHLVFQVLLFHFVVLSDMRLFFGMVICK